MLEGKSILITGGCGFIGTNLIKFFIKKYPEYDFYNLDSLTYSGNQANLEEEEEKKVTIILSKAILQIQNL